MNRRRPDPHWRRARIAARIWLKDFAGKTLSDRERRMAALLAADRGVTDRLIEQAVKICPDRYGVDSALNPVR